MRYEENGFVPKSLDNQFLEYIRADVRVNRTERIIEEINVPEMTDILQGVRQTYQYNINVYFWK